MANGMQATRNESPLEKLSLALGTRLSALVSFNTMTFGPKMM